MCPAGTCSTHNSNSTLFTLFPPPSYVASMLECWNQVWGKIYFAAAKIWECHKFRLKASQNFKTEERMEPINELFGRTLCSLIFCFTQEKFCPRVSLSVTDYWLTKEWFQQLSALRWQEIDRKPSDIQQGHRVPYLDLKWCWHANLFIRSCSRRGATAKKSATDVSKVYFNIVLKNLPQMQNNSRIWNEVPGTLYKVQSSEALHVDSKGRTQRKKEHCTSWWAFGKFEPNMGLTALSLFIALLALSWSEICAAVCRLCCPLYYSTDDATEV